LWSNIWLANTRYCLARGLQTTQQNMVKLVACKQHNRTWSNWWPANNTIWFSKRPATHTQYGSNTHLMKTVCKNIFVRFVSNCTYWNFAMKEHSCHERKTGGSDTW